MPTLQGRCRLPVPGTEVPTLFSALGRSGRPDRHAPEEEGQHGGEGGEHGAVPGRAHQQDRGAEGNRHQQEGPGLDARRHGAVFVPFADDRAGDAVGQQPVVQGGRAAREAGRRQQHEGRGRQDGQEDAQEAERQRDAAGAEEKGAHQRGIVRLDGGHRLTGFPARSV